MFYFYVVSCVFVVDSPLSLLQGSNSTILTDLTRMHDNLLFSMRLGMLVYERTINLCTKWAEEGTDPRSGKPTKPGVWSGFDYK